MLILKRKPQALGPPSTSRHHLLLPLAVGKITSKPSKWLNTPQKALQHTLGCYLWTHQFKELTSKRAHQKMPKMQHTFRTAKNWKPSGYFLPLESVHFQLTPCEEASQQGSRALTWTLLPREAQEHTQLLETAQLHRKTHLQLLPLRGKPNECSTSAREVAAWWEQEHPAQSRQANTGLPPVPRATKGTKSPLRSRGAEEGS